MKARFYILLCGLLAPIAAMAANEGVPSYYQTSNGPNANQIGYGQYSQQGYSKYVGTSGNKQVVGTRSTSYQVPRATAENVPATYATTGMMTANGIALPAQNDNKTNLYAGYSRRFADFEFKTGVNSILEWDDMIFNEINVGAQHNFSLRNFDMFVYGQYAYGRMESGGLSMDYDLQPYESSAPNDGIFTISMGDQSGTTNHFKFGIGAHHIWDIAGWKLSPSIGYEIFKHNLKMSDHYYPNPGIYLPLLTNKGDYVFGDGEGNYYAFPQGVEAPDDLYQVCMSPEDIKLVQASAGAPATGAYLDGLVIGDYDPIMGTVPWGVGPNDCVIIGGDGPVIVEGTTHIYDTTWSGFFVGLEIEKQMTLADKLRFYVQFGLPKYSSDGTWPMRDDWQQNPSFTDEGSSGAYSYAAEMEYNLRLSDRMQLALKVDTNVFHVGKIGGKLYLAEDTHWAMTDDGQYALDEQGLPYLETSPAQTIDVSNSLKEATWQSFGLHLGVKYAF
ncbi:hypothetical protein HDR61_00540 [bacterium]|nr:hypothetical protein [bacterium]